MVFIYMSKLAFTHAFYVNSLHLCKFMQTMQIYMQIYANLLSLKFFHLCFLYWLLTVDKKDIKRREFFFIYFMQDVIINDGMKVSLHKFISIYITTWSNQLNIHESFNCETRPVIAIKCRCYHLMKKS